MEQLKVKRIAFAGMLVALAFVLSFVEYMIPIHLGIPGVKLGLANLVVVVSLYTLGEKQSFVISMIRVLLVAFTFGNLSALMYAAGGAILSFGVMVAAKKSNFFGVNGVSVLGGIFHNIGQIVVAAFIVENARLFYYLPILLLSGVLAGFLIGILSGMVTKRIMVLYAKES